LKNFITLSGRRWNPHGSSKEGSGKEAGSKKASQEGGSKEEIIFNYPNTFFSMIFIRLYTGENTRFSVISHLIFSIP